MKCSLCKCYRHFASFLQRLVIVILTPPPRKAHFFNLFIFFEFLFCLVCLFYHVNHTRVVGKWHCQSFSFSIRRTDGPPQVPAWKTADLRGMSWLINSCHKWECFPCTDWYTPAFASFASRDVRPCTSGGAWAVWKFRRNLLKHRISFWSFDEDGLSFHVTVP